MIPRELDVGRVKDNAFGLHFARLHILSSLSLAVFTFFELTAYRSSP